MEIGTHRPRNVNWMRAAALLYGDWGTSKAYVIGLAFVAIGFASFPIILAVCALTVLVAYNYTIVCKYFPDGGGVYSAARSQARFFAVMGALLLVANFTVTAAMSGWAAMAYFGLPDDSIKWATAGAVVIVGLLNYWGPKHSGSLALGMAVPMVVVVLLIIGLSVPHLTLDLQPASEGFRKNWVAFVGVILALSGVEAVANLTGVMQLDPDATMEQPKVARTARKAIWPVAIEVVLGTTLLGWAMLSLPHDMEPVIKDRWEDMVRFLGEHYGAVNFGLEFGKIFGIIVGIVVGLLLLSAVNTAVSALIGLFYMMARDGEMPRSFTRLNPHGVPWVPLAIAVLGPVAVTMIVPRMESLAGLYAIGVVGAITVNLGSCTFNRKLPLRWYERIIMGLSFLILFAVELTIAESKDDALFFACAVLGVGFAVRWYALKRAGYETVMVSREVAAAVKPEVIASLKPDFTAGQSILVAARGITPVLKFALEEARLRQGTLYVVYIKQIAVSLLGPITNRERPRWQDDPAAAKIMYSIFQMAENTGVSVLPVYAVSDNPAATILDIAATLGVDMLILGAPHRTALSKLLRGDVVTEVARNLPENIQVIIYG